jgi:hypothetical protein
VFLYSTAVQVHLLQTKHAVLRVNQSWIQGRAIAQVGSRQSLTAKTRVRAQVSPCGICSEHSGTGTGFSPEFFRFPLSLSFCRGSPYCYITWRINNRAVGNRSSETETLDTLLFEIFSSLVGFSRCGLFYTVTWLFSAGNMHVTSSSQIITFR